ncbi:hypothetical protein NC653_005072 [Populus alba x Populus x berolinensis]|uniref:Uncharacterized protein n=1 Tax=Populus alba x Populus x berolinensis TaxID=444605 RepID=A0AAD6RBF0_9ROSI|nr:hypothetical protein NC653_005072 [Populus alba x Populus x berolinensis]
MALPFDVEFFLMDMRFEHDRSERLHKQEYEALHHDLISDIPCSSSEMYYSSSSPELHLRLLTQKSGFYSKAKKALAQMKYKPLESTAEACLKRKQAKSDNLAAE